MTIFDKVAELVVGEAEHCIDSRANEFKDRSLISLLVREINPNENIEFAFFGSYQTLYPEKNYLSSLCFFICTDRKILISYSWLTWSIETVYFNDIEELVPEASDKKKPEGFWGFVADVGKAMVGSMKIRMKDERVFSISSIDKPKVEFLLDTVSTKMEKRYKSRPTVFNSNRIDNISGSNISINSQNTHQYSYTNPNQDIAEILSAVAQILQNSTRISDEVKQEALDDLNTLDTELSKSSPNNKVIKFMLDNLDKIPQIKSAIESLRDIIF